jgi:hypothetical protein
MEWKQGQWIVQHPLNIVCLAPYTDTAVTSGKVQALVTMHEVHKRVVPSKKTEHKTGELSHYMDGVWVLSGPEGSHERLVCYRVDDDHFVALHYCSGFENKSTYVEFLNLLDRAWLKMNTVENDDGEDSDGEDSQVEHD